MIWNWARRCYTSSASTTSSSEFCRGRCQPHLHLGGWVIPSVGWESLLVFLYSKHAHRHLFMLELVEAIDVLFWIRRCISEEVWFRSNHCSREAEWQHFFSSFFMRIVESGHYCVHVCFLLIMLYNYISNIKCCRIVKVRLWNFTHDGIDCFLHLPFLLLRTMMWVHTSKIGFRKQPRWWRFQVRCCQLRGQELNMILWGLTKHQKTVAK